jgi:DNA-directed RNA polymerase specialized sigma24 family protein
MSDTVAIPTPPEGDFERFLRHLDEDRSCAAEMYEDLRRRLHRFFVYNHSCRAEELVDRTLAILEKKIQSEDICNVFAYALGIARKVHLAACAELQRITALEDMPRGEDSFADPRTAREDLAERIETQGRLGCLRKCRSTLSSADDKLVIGYYSADGEKQKVHRERLAKEIGVTVNLLRVRTNRIREKLEKCLGKCLDDRRGGFADGRSGRQK